MTRIKTRQIKSNKGICLAYREYFRRLSNVVAVDEANKVSSISLGSNCTKTSPPPTGEWGHGSTWSSLALNMTLILTILSQLNQLLFPIKSVSFLIA